MSDKQQAHNPPLKPATQPTQARPGSDEKQLVMAARWERGEMLHHEDDFSVRGNGDEGGHSCKWQMGDGVVVHEVPND